MSITDELREYVGNFYLFRYKDVREKLNEIADRIDAEHKKACDDAWDNGYEADYLGIEKWLTEHPQVMEHHGWVRLPLDADGVSIHVGDVMEADDGTTFEVEHISLYQWGWRCVGEGTDRSGVTCTAHAIPDGCRHYHATTVEDVLREFVERLDEIGSEDDCAGVDEQECRACIRRDIAAAYAEYAAKLRLAGEGE